MANVNVQLTMKLKKVCHLVVSSSMGGDMLSLYPKPFFLAQKNKIQLISIITGLLILAATQGVCAQSENVLTVEPTPSVTAEAAENANDLGPVELTLDQAVREGLRHNLDLMASQYNIPIAEAAEITASLPGNPSLILDTIFEPFASNWNQTSAGGPRQFDAGLALPLDFSDKYGMGKKDAQAGTGIAKAQFEDIVRQKILLIRQDYINVVTQQHNVALYKERADNYAKLVHVIENRIGVVKAQPLLLMRATLARDQALIDLRQNENNLRSAKTLLAIQLGRPPSDNAFAATTELRQFEMIDTPDKDTVINQAMENRPDLKAIKLIQEKAKLDHQLADNQSWNDVTITAEVSKQGPTDGSPDGTLAPIPEGYSWDLALNIPFPLLNQNQGLVKTADLTGQQAQKQADSLDLSIRQEIGDELAQLKIDHDLIEQYEATQIKNARKVRDEQQKLFGTGNMNLLDYF
ncbi:MAG TPA: TolC family protein, partial [bacterium]|nr:TolC family protein [bacterium]